MRVAYALVVKMCAKLREGTNWHCYEVLENSVGYYILKNSGWQHNRRADSNQRGKQFGKTVYCGRSYFLAKTPMQLLVR